MLSVNASEVAGSNRGATASQRVRRGLLVWLPPAGLASGVICAAIMPFRVSALLYGLIFSALIGGSLRVARLFGNREWAWFTLASEIGACVSAYGGAGVDMLGYRNFESPVGFFVGGVLAGVFISTPVFWPFRRPRGHRLSALLKIIGGTICGGVLALAGRALADSLGTGLWRLLHAFDLTGYKLYPTDEGEFGPANLVYSSFVVWQTGMGLVLGLLLWRGQRTSDPEESLA